MAVAALVLGAGVGARMRSPVNKHLLMLAGVPLLVHALRAFQAHPDVGVVVLVAGRERLDIYAGLARQYGLDKVAHIVAGGATRQESCYNGLHVLSAWAADDLVAVHDAARPLVSQAAISAAIGEAALHGAAVVAVPAKDTIKLATEDGFVAETLPRTRLWQVQTPQVFRLGLFRRAHEAALRDGFVGTDDTVLVERLGQRVKLAPGEYSNIKVTTAEDMVVAEALLGALAAGDVPPGRAASGGPA